MVRITAVTSFVLKEFHDEDIVRFLAEQRENRHNGVLHCGEEGMRNPVFGFNSNHLLPYISDQTFEGSFVLHEGVLIYQPTAPRLQDMRDSYLWASSVTQFYASLSGRDVIEEHVRAGYSLMRYAPQNSYSVPFVHCKKNLQFFSPENLRPFSLADLAASLAIGD